MKYIIVIAFALIVMFLYSALALASEADDHEEQLLRMMFDDHGCGDEDE